MLCRCTGCCPAAVAGPAVAAGLRNRCNGRQAKERRRPEAWFKEAGGARWPGARPLPLPTCKPPQRCQDPTALTTHAHKVEEGCAKLAAGPHRMQRALVRQLGRRDQGRKVLWPSGWGSQISWQCCQFAARCEQQLECGEQTNRALQCSTAPHEGHNKPHNMPATRRPAAAGSYLRDLRISRATPQFGWVLPRHEQQAELQAPGGTPSCQLDS